MGGNEEDLKKWWDNMHINDEYNKGDKKKEKKMEEEKRVKDWYKKLNIFLNRWENDNFINKIKQKLTEEKIVKMDKIKINEFLKIYDKDSFNNSEKY